MTDLSIVKIYMQEHEDHLTEILKVLHDEVKVMHVIVLRAIEGFSENGKPHSTHFLSLSLDLPLVIEFFDTPEKTSLALSSIKKIGIKGHILKLQAQAFS